MGLVDLQMSVLEPLNVTAIQQWCSSSCQTESHGIPETMSSNQAAQSRRSQGLAAKHHQQRQVLLGQ